jgi:hypothetical protein
MSDFDKPGGEDMRKKAMDELLSGDGDQSVLSWIVIVSGSEGNVTSSEAYQPVIGDGHSMSVTTDVAIGLMGAAEGFFAVDYPFVAFELSCKALELD